MPTERLDATREEDVQHDRQTLKMVADYFAMLGLGPRSLVIQAGVFKGTSYVLRVRFLDLWLPTQNNAQRTFLTVEHSEKDPKVWRNRRVLMLWVLDRCYETIPLAHAEWQKRTRRPWPDGFPTPEYARRVASA